MRTEPVEIEGLAGPVVVDVHAFSGKSSITVGGRPATKVRGTKYTLPTAAGGEVPATVRSVFGSPYPLIEIAGVKHPTGPLVPLALRVLALLPLALLGIGGAVGGAIGAVGVIGNFAILRGSQSTAVKALLMVLVLVAVGVAWTGLAVAIAAGTK